MVDYVFMLYVMQCEWSLNPLLNKHDEYVRRPYKVASYWIYRSK